MDLLALIDGFIEGAVAISREEMLRLRSERTGAA
jgi:hypothetical protein